MVQKCIKCGECKYCGKELKVKKGLRSLRDIPRYNIICWTINDFRNFCSPECKNKYEKVKIESTLDLRLRVKEVYDNILEKLEKLEKDDLRL